MIETIALFFGDVISVIYGYVPNFGVAIIILTIIVKLITFPLNNKQIQTTKRMQMLQPEMKKIQQKYKDDKQKQNQAVSEFMKENNMNPLSGCLPLLIQFPILIGIFRLLRDPEIVEQKIGEAFSPFLFPSAEIINLLSLPSDLFVDINTLLSQLTLNFMDYGIYYLFPLIAGATTFVYSKLSTPADSSQKMMLYLMPAMITVFSFSFPVGLVLYWTMNNVFSIGQHKVVNYLDSRKEEKQEAVKTETKAAAKTKVEHTKPDKVSQTQKEQKKDQKEREKDFFKVGSEIEDREVENNKTGSGQKADLEDGKPRKKKKGKGKK